MQYKFCGRTYVVKVIRNELSTPPPAQTSHQPTRNLVCKPHAGAIAHLCGRDSPRMRAQPPSTLARPTRP
eukprot:1581716-Pyramimonas_sp.AAC.1